MKLGRLKRDCDDMGTLMAALVKYADSDGTKDPPSDDERTGTTLTVKVPSVDTRGKEERQWQGSSA